MESQVLRPLAAVEVSRPYKPNFILAWLYAIFFSKIQVDPEWVRAVREAAQRGTVVYVMRSVSYLDFVALDFFLKRHALPLVRFVSNLGMWILEPMGKGLRRLFSRAEPEGPALERTVAGGGSALLFMRRPTGSNASQRHADQNDVDYVRLLIARQRLQEHPILLVPQVFVWGRRPDRLHKGVVDQIFGPQEYPGRLRMVAQMVWHFGNAQLRACEPLDLKALLADHTRLDDEALVNKIHWLLVTRLDRERRVILGPMSKGPDRLKQEILRNPRIREAVNDAVRREKKPLATLERQLRRDLDRLEARPHPLAFVWADRVLNWVFHRIYQGIEIDRDGIHRIREAARRGPVVLLPSHKSHLDYLLLSYVFYNEGLQCPLIAAGDNLAFWPAGPILRRCGAFFIRRSFKGARLYTTLVDTYVRKILKEGYAIEFFVEGGRSRSGKLLSPKVGLLSMVADAADAAGVPVTYVPISIGYEKIVEQRSYEQELAGGEKRKEDAGALLTRAPRVLTAKYGRAYVQVGEVLDFGYTHEGDAEATAPTATTTREVKRAAVDRVHARRAEIQRLADRVTAEINRVTPVTPTALAATVLLDSRRRGIPREELLARVDALVTDLQSAGARFAESLAVGYEGGRRPYRLAAIDQAINVFVEGSLIQVHGDASDAIYQVPDDRRLALDFYKNNLIHFFVPGALVAIATLAAGGAQGPVPRGTVLARTRTLASAFAHEFPTVELGSALDRLVARGDLTLVGAGDDATVEILGADALDRVEFRAGLVRNFVESYRVAARALTVLSDGAIPAKELLNKALAVGDRMFLTGEVRRREAISKPNLEHAFAAFRASGYLAGGEAGPQRMHASADAATVEATYAAYL